MTRSDDRWPDDPVGWAMPTSCARRLNRAAAWTGLISALGGAFVGLVVTLIVWLVEASGTGSAVQAMRAGLLLFLAAHHGGVSVAGSTVQFVPLVLLAAVFVLPWRAGRSVAQLADQRGQRAGLGRALVGLWSSYAATCSVLVAIGRIGSSHADLVTTVLAAAVVAAVGSGAGARRELTRRDGGTFVPPRLLPAARCAVAALAVLAGSSALLIATSLALHAGRVTELTRDIGGSGAGGVLVTLLGILCGPNAVVATSSVLVGPGFAVGSDTVLRISGAHSGLLPAFPLLGALPAGTGPHPLVLSWAAGTFVALGLAVSRAARPVRGSSARVRTALTAALLAGAAMAGLAALAGGKLGSGRLAAVGASPWQAGLAVTGEVLAAGALTAAAAAMVGAVRRVASSRTPAPAQARVGRPKYTDAAAGPVEDAGPRTEAAPARESTSAAAGGDAGPGPAESGRGRGGGLARGA